MVTDAIFGVRMNLGDMDAAQRKAVAGDPATPPDLLAELGSDWRLVSEVAANPSTPADTREDIYREFPHLRAQPVPGAVVGEVDDAIAAFRARAARKASARSAMARYERSQYSGTSARDAVPTGAVVYVGTNGLAITSLVTALIGAFLLAIVFGHVAKSQIANSGERGGGMATAGLILGYLQAAAVAVVFLSALWSSLV